MTPPAHRDLTRLEEEEHTRLATKASSLTTILNGHAHDINGMRTPFASTGGLYEDKRYDRAEVEVALRVHEFFFDHRGRRSR